MWRIPLNQGQTLYNKQRISYMLIAIHLLNIAFVIYNHLLDVRYVLKSANYPLYLFTGDFFSRLVLLNYFL